MSEVEARRAVRTAAAQGTLAALLADMPGEEFERVLDQLVAARAASLPVEDAAAWCRRRIERLEAALALLVRAANALRAATWEPANDGEFEEEVLRGLNSLPTAWPDDDDEEDDSTGDADLDSLLADL